MLPGIREEIMFNHFRRVAALIVIDALLVSVALLLALWLRFDGNIPQEYLHSYRQTVGVFILVNIGVFYAFGFYHRLWQYAGLEDLRSLLYGVTLATLLNTAYSFVLMRGGELILPRTSLGISWMLIFLFIGASRLSLRLFRDYWSFALHLRDRRPVLVIGAGAAGALVVRELRRQNSHHSIPVGFIDDHPAKQRQKLCGLPVLGARDDIPRLVRKYGVKEIIIAIPTAPGRVIREITDICHSSGEQISLKILPGLYDEIGEGVAVSQIRRLQVEDLLGREPVKVDLESMAGYLSGRVVLVTGAGGSIGSELCRQVLRFSPERLLMLGHGENSIYEIFQELSSAGVSGASVLAPLIADIKDEAAMAAIFEQYRPQVVFHAAAHKHVPLMEENPLEAVKNNISGTWCLARAALQRQVGTFILISTDKAVHPTSIMGATKRVAEMVIQQLSREGKTRFAAVRFGNVLDSRGSVVPLFRRQIDLGGPVTVTHPEMTRFFMTIAEAVQLVIQAGAMAGGGELFVLDMGEPVKIIDLARRMIRLAGLEPEKDIKIVYSGIRPGEKLFEELLTSQEGVSATLHQRIFVARPDQVEPASLQRLLSIVGRPGWSAGPEEVVARLQAVLPDFRADEQLFDQAARG